MAFDGCLTQRHWTTAQAPDDFHNQIEPLLPATLLIAFSINGCYVCPWSAGLNADGVHLTAASSRRYGNAVVRLLR